jgi:hypothetical protein
MNGMGVQSLRMGLGNLYPLAEVQGRPPPPPGYRQAKKVKAEVDGEIGKIRKGHLRILQIAKYKNSELIG